jgi:hypothetical protein
MRGIRNSRRAHGIHLTEITSRFSEIDHMDERRFRWLGLILALTITARTALTAEAGETNQRPDSGGEHGPLVSRNRELSQRMSDAWDVVWSRCYDPRTSQFFTAEPARLPSAERIKRLEPNECGYGTGMDDGPLFGGILLVAICDQYDVTHEDSLRADALSVFSGLKLCATAHGVPGFVARGVCPEDGKSIYITSSRDQGSSHFLCSLMDSIALIAPS